ncbi:glycosyltransferase family 2 protein [Microbacterium awajiense]|uniref:4,4'-diaponeurosporenoate glycosyltransferase n=1 Tax=Microbacterium awajiense TaxID=415214 RepID=A0ABP7AXA1_9MICO
MNAQDAIDGVVVAIPAHDEEELLGACLESVALAARAAQAGGVSVDTWVALDDCSDRSEAIARAAGVHTVALTQRRVGAARRAAIESALADFGEAALSSLWLAHTDADSVVPPHWLVHQLRLARDGADVVIGTVRPDFRDLTERQSAAWWRTHVPGVANGHVHGANLGIRASTYLAACGFPPVAAHEDVALVDATRAAGARIVASDAAWVRTSGRGVGRAPDGYARYLRDDLESLAAVAGSDRAAEIALL